MGAHSGFSGGSATSNHGKGRHRKQKHHRLEPYAWLGAGALTMGLGAAALTGAGVAQAAEDGGSGGPSSSSSSSSDSGGSAGSTGGSAAGSSSSPSSTGSKDDSSGRASSSEDKSEASGSATGASSGSDTETKANDDADDSAKDDGSDSKTLTKAAAVEDVDTVDTEPVEQPDGKTATKAVSVELSAPSGAAEEAKASEPVTDEPAPEVAALALALAAASTKEEQAAEAVEKGEAATADASIQSASSDQGTALVATIPVPDVPSIMAVSPGGTRLYVVQSQSGSLTVVDAEKDIVLGSPIFVGANPSGIVLTPDGRRAYIAASAGDAGQIVSVFDTAAMQLTATILLSTPATAGGVSPTSAIVMNPQGTYVYARTVDGYYAVISTVTNEIVGSINGVADFSPDGKTIYGWNGSSVIISDADTNSELSRLYPSGSVVDVTVSTDGGRLYVLTGSPSGIWENILINGKITVYDTFLNHNLGTIPLGMIYTTSSVSVSADGTQLYTFKANISELAVFDTTNLSQVNSISLGSSGSPSGLTFSKDGSRLYFIDLYSLVAVDTTTNTVVGRFGLATEILGQPNVLKPSMFEVGPDGSRVYIGLTDKKLVAVVNPNDTAGTFYVDEDPGASPSRAAVAVEAQKWADLIRAATGYRNAARTPTPENSQDEINWENNWEVFNLYVSWIPVVGTFLNGVSLGYDIGDYINAVADGRTADMEDELTDIFGDLAGMIPVVGGFLAYWIAVGDIWDNSINGSEASIVGANSSTGYCGSTGDPGEIWSSGSPSSQCAVLP